MSESALVAHARAELEAAGLLAEHGPYDGMIGQAVLELVQTFADQGHSGYSAGMTLEAFHIVAGWGVLTPLTFEDDQWVKHDNDVWQHRRKSSVFSADRGATWYDLDEEGQPPHEVVRA